MAGLSFLPCGSDLGARDDRPRRVLHRPSNRAAGLTESRRERDEHCENQKGDPANQRHVRSFENLFFAPVVPKIWFSHELSLLSFANTEPPCQNRICQS